MSVTAQNVLQRLGALVQRKAGGEPVARAWLRSFTPSLLGIVIFLAVWHVAAQGIVTRS